jgi:hypothetical protein
MMHDRLPPSAIKCQIIGFDLKHRNFLLHDDVDNRKVHGVFNTFELRGNLEVFGGKAVCVQEGVEGTVILAFIGSERLTISNCVVTKSGQGISCVNFQRNAGTDTPELFTSF